LKKRRAIHPYLFALFPVISLYAHNIDQVPVRSALVAMAGSLIMAAVVFNLLKSVFKDSAKGALASTFILIVFFSYGHIHSFLLDWIAQNYTHRADFEVIDQVAECDILVHVFLVTAFLLVGHTLIVRVLRRRPIGSESTRVLNVVSVVLITFPLVTISSYGLKVGMSPRPKNEEVRADAIQPVAKKRDIYFIILDGYGREDILHEFYGFDNSEFINNLEKRGFYVVEKSCANYAWTFLSLASSLHLDYVNYLAGALGETSTDLRIPYEMIKDSRVVKFLRDRGYVFVHFNSTWGATLNNKYADKEIDYRRGLFRDEFLRILVQSTMLKMMDPLIVMNLAGVHLNSFSALETIPEIEEPTFSFFHSILPHHPYIFDRFGNVRSQATMWNQFRRGMWKDGDAYIEQLVFVNTKIMAAVDRILENSDVAPIIVIQSDHGPLLDGVSEDDYIRARMCCLNACYLPNGGDRLLYDSVSPVNTFRIIFNSYFHTNQPLLEDRCYFSRFVQPYGFVEVTEEIKKD